MFNKHFSNKIIYLLSALILFSCSEKNSNNFDISKNYDYISLYSISLQSNSFELKQYFNELESINSEIYKKVDIDNKNIFINNFNNISNEEKYKRLTIILATLKESNDIEDRILEEKISPLKKLHADLYNITAQPIDKNLHMVWLGGPLGEKQKNYIRVWQELNPEYKLNIWYDSENLFAYNSQKIIRSYFEKTFNMIDNESNVNSIEKYKSLSLDFIKIQDELHGFLMEEKIKNPLVNLDDKRIEFINKKLLKSQKFDVKKLEDIRKQMLDDIKNYKQSSPNLQFRDFKDLKNNWVLKNPYFQEMNLRTNFAAAGDIVRLETLSAEGGMYLDVDILPKLKTENEIFDKMKVILPKKFLKGEFRNFIAALYEEVMNNRKLFPQNETPNYSVKEKLFNSLQNTTFYSEVQKNQLIALFKEHIAKITAANIFSDIFTSLSEIKVRENEFKTANQINSVIAMNKSTAEDSWVLNLKKDIQIRYDILNSFPENNPREYYPKSKDVEINMDRKIFKYKGKRSKLILDLYAYRFDSIFSDVKTTLYVTGPNVYFDMLKNKFGLLDENRSPGEFVSNALYFDDINNYFSQNTPEDLKSSWLLRSNEKIYNGLKQKRFIISLSNDVNERKAAQYLFNKYNNDKNQDTFLITDMNSIVNNEALDYAQIYLVGHSSENEEQFKLSNLDSKTISNSIRTFKENNKINKIQYLDFVTCNPTNNRNNTESIEIFAAHVMENLEVLNSPVELSAVRTRHIFITQDGDQYTKNKFGLLTPINYKDKIYIIKNENDFITIDSKYLYKNLNENKKYKIKKSSVIINNLLKYKSIELGEFKETIEDISAANYNNYKNTKVQNIISDIRVLNKLDNNYIPIFSSLNKQKNEIIFVNYKTNQYIKTVILSNKNINYLNEYKNIIDNEFKSIKEMNIKINQNGEIENTGLGLNPLFLTQALFNLFKNNSEEYNSDDENLNMALRLHGYLNDAQLTIASADTLLQLKSLVNNVISTKNLANSSEFITSFAGSNFQKLSTGIGLGINIASLFFDIYEYKNATNATEKIIFSTQIAMDSSFLAMGTLQLGTSLLSSTAIGASLGLSTASTVIGYIGVPFAGLAIGFSGLAGAAAFAQAESVVLGSHFLKYERDHEHTGVFLPDNKDTLTLSHVNFIKKDSKWSAENNSAVIKSINLAENDLVKITFDSHLMSKTKASFGIAPKSYSSLFNSQPAADLDRQCDFHTKICKFNFTEHNSFSVREALSIPATKDIKITKDTAIILPSIPQKKISYDYAYTIGIMSRNDAELKPFRKMENYKPGHFLFEFLEDGLVEYAIRGLNYDIDDHSVYIELGEHNRTLIVPEIFNEDQNKTVYHFKSKNSSKYNLYLSNSFNRYVFDNEAYENLTIVVPENNTSNPKFLSNEETLKLKIGLAELYFKNIPKNILIKYSNGNTYTFNGNNFNLVSIDKKFSRSDLNSIDKFLEEEENRGILINKFYYISPDNNVNGFWYDTELKEIIRPDNSDISKNYFINTVGFISNESLVAPLDSEMELISKNNDEYYFYNRSRLEFYIYLKNENNIFKAFDFLVNIYAKDGAMILEFIDGTKVKFVNSNSAYLYSTNNNITTLNDFRKKKSNICNSNFYFAQDPIKIRFDIPVNYVYNRWFFPQISKFIELPKLSNAMDKYDLLNYKINLNNKIEAIISKQSKANISLFKYSEANNFMEEIFIENITDIQKVNENILVHTSKGVIYSLDENYQSQVIGFDKNWLKINVNTNLEEVIKNELRKNKKFSNNLFIIDSQNNYYTYKVDKNILIFNFKGFKVLGLDQNENVVYSNNKNEVFLLSLALTKLSNFRIINSVENSKITLSAVIKPELNIIKNKEIDVRIF